LGVGHESEDGLVIIVTRDGSRDVVALGDFRDEAPLVRLFAVDARLVKEAIAVLKAANENELVLVVAPNLDNSRAHAPLGHLGDLHRLFQGHVLVEDQLATLVDKGLISQLEGQVVPFVEHEEELEVNFAEA